MNDYLNELLVSGEMRDAHGERIPLSSGIDRDKVELIQRTIVDGEIKRVVEVGCAMGISSLAIQDALQPLAPATVRHVIIDPNQTHGWGQYGVLNLKRAGLENYELIEEVSEFALAEMARKGEAFDFGYIDGWHTFDHTLVDFFFINRLLKPGGYFAVDDIHMPGINRFVRYVSNYPAYELVDTTPARTPSASRRMVDAVRTGVGALAQAISPRLAREFLSPESIRSDRDLGLFSSMAVFKKIADDDRPWNWYESF